MLPPTHTTLMPHFVQNNYMYAWQILRLTKFVSSSFGREWMVASWGSLHTTEMPISPCSSCSPWDGEKTVDAKHNAREIAPAPRTSCLALLFANALLQVVAPSLNATWQTMTKWGWWWQWVLRLYPSKVCATILLAEKDLAYWFKCTCIVRFYSIEF